MEYASRNDSTRKTTEQMMWKREGDRTEKTNKRGSESTYTVRVHTCHRDQQTLVQMHKLKTDRIGRKEYTTRKTKEKYTQIYASGH